MVEKAPVTVASHAAPGDLLRRDELGTRCSTSALKGAGDDGFTRRRTQRSALDRCDALEKTHEE